jgi:hypothetical protein
LDVAPYAACPQPLLTDFLFHNRHLGASLAKFVLIVQATQSDPAVNLLNHSVLTMSASDLYSPLPGDSFRVLKILTADENEIICELQHFTFDEAPEYIALSYAVSERDPYGSNL